MVRSEKSTKKYLLEADGQLYVAYIIFNESR